MFRMPEYCSSLTTGVEYILRGAIGSGLGTYHGESNEMWKPTPFLQRFHEGRRGSQIAYVCCQDTMSVWSTRPSLEIIHHGLHLKSGGIKLLNFIHNPPRRSFQDYLKTDNRHPWTVQLSRYTVSPPPGCPHIYLVGVPDALPFPDLSPAAAGLPSLGVPALPSASSSAAAALTLAAAAAWALAGKLPAPVSPPSLA